MRPTGSTLTVVSANLEEGGIDPDGSTQRREQTAALLKTMNPDIVLVQELIAWPGRERREFRALANLLGLEPAAWSPPRGAKRQRSGILVRTGTLTVLDDGPDYPGAPCQAEAIVRHKATETHITVVSVHAAASNAVEQVWEAQRLASKIGRGSTPAIAGGDWNCYVPGDPVTEDELRDRPELLPARTIIGHGEYTISHQVHDTLQACGLADPVPLLPQDRLHPAHPGGTGSTSGRIDRIYLYPGALLPAVLRYDQVPNPGSDHDAIAVTIDMDAAAGIVT